MPNDAGCLISSFYVCSPIGSMIIKSCLRGLHEICQSDAIDDSNFDEIAGKCPILKHDADLEKLKVNNPITSDCVHWLSFYFMDPLLVSTMEMPKLCPSLITDKFQSRVWIILAQQIGPGQTISYKELAKLANSPGAARAVGSAMSSNPFQIVVPCHRVLPSTGKLGNYAFGKKNKVKAWLLHHEGVSLLN